MEFIKIEASTRTATGKTANARLRRAGSIPAVAYGLGATAQELTITPKALVTALNSVHGRNAVLEIVVDGTNPYPALVTDYQIHPLSRQLTHVDLLRIDLNKPVEIDVPMVCIGKCVGVTEGGVLRQVYRTLPISCLPAQIPVAIDHDITELKQGEVAKAADLKLPEGVVVRLAADQTIIAIVAPEVEKPEEGAEEAAAAAEGAVPVEGAPAAAAPAAAAAVPAKKEKEKK